MSGVGDGRLHPARKVLPVREDADPVEPERVPDVFEILVGFAARVASKYEMNNRNFGCAPRPSPLSTTNWVDRTVRLCARAADRRPEREDTGSDHDTTEAVHALPPGETTRLASVMQRVICITGPFTGPRP